MLDVRCPDCGSLWFRLVDGHTVQVKCRQAHRKGVKPHRNPSGLYRVKLGMPQTEDSTPVVPVDMTDEPTAVAASDPPSPA